MGSLFQLAFVLMVVGMVIAYIGDRLGTFVGKKRISKLGLRPRHTAILYTTVTGGIIPLLALWCFTLINQQFTHQLTDYGNKVAQINRLNKKIDAAKITVAQSQTDANDARADAAIARADANRARIDAQIASKSSALRIAALHTKLTGEETIYTQQITAERQKLAGAQTDLDGARANLSSAQSELASAKAQGTAAAANLKVYEKRVKADQIAVHDRERDLARLNNEYKTLIALNEDLQRRKQQLEVANVYHTGDEVGRTVVYTSETPDQIKGRLTGWLEALSRTAAHRGAGPGQNTRDIVVEGDGSEKQDESVPEDSSLDTLAEHISQLGSSVSSVVVVANVRFNSTLGEQVRIDLQSFDNLLVFSKGEAVASTTIDGSQSEDVVMNQLVHFVSQKVQRVAIDRAIMPSIDPTTLGKSYGQADHLLDAVGKIQQAGTSTQVIAIASDDVYTSGPLTVHLEVVPPPSASTVTSPSATSPSSAATIDSSTILRSGFGGGTSDSHHRTSVTGL